MPAISSARSALVRLKAELHGIEARVAQCARAIVIQADTTRDEIGVKLCLARGANDFREVAPGEWFAAGKPDLQNAQRGCFTKDAVPFTGG